MQTANERIRKRDQGQSESYRGESEDIENLIAEVEERTLEEQKALLGALERYNSEGEGSGYRADTRELVRFLTELRMVGRFVDLGAGSGDLIRTLAQTRPNYGPSTRTDYLGVDLSPSFVRTFNNARSVTQSAPGEPEGLDYKDFLTEMRVGLIDSQKLVNKLKKEGWDGANVTSILTLDRVANPRQLIDNMRLFKGTKILGTILPVVPEDDNPSRQELKITYTPVEKRLVPGDTVEEDRAILKAGLERVWGGPIENVQIPYTVESSGDTQTYELDLFVKLEAPSQYTVPAEIAFPKIKK